MSSIAKNNQFLKSCRISNSVGQRKLNNVGIFEEHLFPDKNVLNILQNIINTFFKLQVIVNRDWVLVFNTCVERYCVLTLIS